MGIQVEFNPDLALRNYSQFEEKSRKSEECIPRDLEVGMTYHFLKKDQRNYWLHGEIPLLETEGEGKLSKPLASIQILEVTHFLQDGVVWTRGTYKVLKIIEEGTIYFNGFNTV